MDVYFQQSVDQITMADNLKQIEELTNEKDKFRSEVGLIFKNSRFIKKILSYGA